MSSEPGHRRQRHADGCGRRGASCATPATCGSSASVLPQIPGSSDTEERSSVGIVHPRATRRRLTTLSVRLSVLADRAPDSPPHARIAAREISSVCVPLATSVPSPVHARTAVGPAVRPSARLDGRACRLLHAWIGEPGSSVTSAADATRLTAGIGARGPCAPSRGATRAILTQLPHRPSRLACGRAGSQPGFCRRSRRARSEQRVARPTVERGTGCEKTLTPLCARLARVSRRRPATGRDPPCRRGGGRRHARSYATPIRRRRSREVATQTSSHCALMNPLAP